MTEALPNFFSHLLLDHKVDRRNIRIVNDNARSQVGPSACYSSSSSSSRSNHSLEEKDSRFQAINRWNHDAGYDSDTSLMFAGGVRKASLEPAAPLPATASSSSKTVRFQGAYAYDSDLDCEIKWAKPSSDSCLSIPQRKSSLTKNSLDEEGKRAMSSGRPPRSRLSKSKSPPKQPLNQREHHQRQSRRASVDTLRSPTTTTSSSPRPHSTTSSSSSRRRQGRRVSLDCTYTGEPSMVAATIPTRSYSHGSPKNDSSSGSQNCNKESSLQQEQQHPQPKSSSSSSSTNHASHSRRAVMGTCNATASSAGIGRKVTPPNTPRLKKKSKTHRSPVRNNSESSSTQSAASLKYQLPMGYMAS
jgi:hypothetical protein